MKGCFPPDRRVTINRSLDLPLPLFADELSRGKKSVGTRGGKGAVKK